MSKKNHYDYDYETDENTFLKIIMDKLNAMEARIEDNFTQMHSQMGELRYEFKQQIDGVKESIREIEKSLENAWAAIEDVQQESKAYKDSKRSHQEMLDKQTNLIQQLQSEVRNLRRLDSRKTDRFGKLYKEREPKVHEHPRTTGRKLLRFSIDRVGKPAVQNVDNSTSARPRPIIARFVSREHTEQVLGVKNRLKKSDSYKDAYITRDYARAIQEERRSLIKAMFVAREKGRNAKVINRSLFIDSQAYDINSIPNEYRPVC